MCFGFVRGVLEERVEKSCAMVCWLSIRELGSNRIYDERI